MTGFKLSCVTKISVQRGISIHGLKHGLGGKYGIMGCMAE